MAEPDYFYRVGHPFGSAHGYEVTKCFGVHALAYGNLYLCILLVVKLLCVRLMLADEWVNEQQEEHVQDKAAHNRQVDYYGHLWEENIITFNTMAKIQSKSLVGILHFDLSCIERTTHNTRQIRMDECVCVSYLDCVTAAFLILAFTEQTISFHIMSGNRHWIHNMQAVTKTQRQTYDSFPPGCN